MIRPTCRCQSESDSERMNRLASRIFIAEISAMFLPPIRAAKAAVRSRLPPQAGQGR